MMIKVKQYPILCLLIIIYFTTLLVGYLSPMQSDDFTFYFNGLSLSEHWSFYMTWSGRFIVDYISALLLACNNHLIITMINSLALPLLIYNLAAIPYYQVTYYIHDRGFIIAIIILWWSYWLTNPALGQTTFWVVGAANYLWVLVFTAMFFRYLLRFSNQSSLSTKQLLFITILAVLTGCSNEATGALSLYCLVLLYGWAHINKLNKQVILGCFIVVLVSYLFLLLAPGNMVRAAHAEYANWRVLEFSKRVINHFTYVIPQILKNYGVIYLLLLWAISKGYKSLKKIDIQLLFIFTVGVIVFCVILIASPHALVARSQLTGLFLLLVILAFLLKAVFYEQREKLFSNILFYIFGITFIFSYSCVVVAYYSFYQQGKFRVEIIKESRTKGIQEVLIPNYYKPYVLRKGDYPELEHHSAGGMGQYYGVKKVNLVFVDFDYLAILNKQCMINYQAMTNNSASLVQCVDIQKMLFSDTVRVVIEFSPEIANINQAYQFALQVSNTFEQTDDRYYSITFPLRILKIGDHYFASADLVASLLAIDENPELLLQIKGPVTASGGDSMVIPVKVEGSYEVM